MFIRPSRSRGRREVGFPWKVKKGLRSSYLGNSKNSEKENKKKKKWRKTEEVRDEFYDFYILSIQKKN